jgi:hypothetical protein
MLQDKGHQGDADEHDNGMQDAADNEGTHRLSRIAVVLPQPGVLSPVPAVS